MRVLVLSADLPVPTAGGGRRRVFELLRRVGRHAELEIVGVAPADDADARHRAAARALFGDVAAFAAQGDDDGAASLAAHGSADASRHVAARLARGGIDLVHAEGFALAGLVPLDAEVPLVVADRDVALDAWPSYDGADGRPSSGRGVVRRAEATRAARLSAWERAALRVAATEEDRAAMLGAMPEVPVGLVPDGCDHRDPEAAGRAHEPDAAGAAPVARGHRPRVVMVANFANAASAEGAAWFAGEVLPAIAARVPDVELQLVGNAPPPDVRALEDRDRVVVVGRVPRTEPYLAGADVVVCPLRDGVGVRPRLLDALRAGCAVVATPVAADGIDGARSALRVADGAAAFAAEVTTLLADERARERLRAAARSASAALPTWDDAARRLQRCWSGAIALGRPLGRIAALP